MATAAEAKPTQATREAESLNSNSDSKGPIETDDSPAVQENKTNPVQNPEASWFPEPLQGWRLHTVQLCLFFGLLLSVMESSIVATSLVTIGRDFNDFIKVNWVVQAYLLTYMGFAVITTRVSDVIGRKWTVAGSFLIFSAFSLGCGLAQTLLQLIALRAFQGIGGSGLYAMTMVVLPEITPRDKAAFIGTGIGLVFAISAVLGPVLGGVITTNAAQSWRWIFWLNVPIGVIALATVLIAYPGSGSTAAKRVKWKQVDFGGALLLLAASILLVFALEEGGAAAFAWDSSVIIATLVIAGTCWVGFGLWIWLLSTKQSTVHPIFSPRILKKPVMAVVIIETLLTGFSFFSVVILLPERFQIVNLNTAELAGIHLLPLLLASALGSFLGGTISRKKNFTFYTLIAANCFILLGLGLLSTLPDQLAITHAQYGFQVLYGIGVGLTFSTVTVMTIINNGPADSAVAQGAAAQGRVLGGSIGLAIAVIIFNSHVVSRLGDVLTPSQLDGLRKSLSSLQSLTLEQQLAVVSVFAQSFNEHLRVCTYIAAVCLVISFFAYQKNPPSILDRRPPPSKKPSQPPGEEKV